MSDADAQLLLKKRARRRLVGAVAFVLFAAVVLPMVMDASPPLPSQEVQIRIPGQEQAIFAPQSVQTAKANADKAEPAPTPAATTPAPAAVASPVSSPSVAPAVVAATTAVAGAAVVAAKPADKASEKPAEKPVAKPADKVADKAPEKTADKKAADKPADKAKPADKNDKKPEAHKGESDRAASILSGKPAPAAAAAAGGSHVILIGAYANPGNVKVLRSKLDQIGVKTFTEILTSPQGNKTRLRAGPFPSKDAADKALEKMKRIGVSGVVSAK